MVLSEVKLRTLPESIEIVLVDDPIPS